MTDRHALIISAFERCFGGEPELFVRAPGRVDLMGSHTDYNLGYVLTLPISRDMWLALRPRLDRNVRMHSVHLDDTASFDLEALAFNEAQHWINYPQGVASALAAEGLALTGFDAVIHSNVPMSSGLSSSAALECATAVAFRELGGWELDAVRMAVLCQRAENQFVGVNCGVLDQYTSCAGEAGRAVLLDCRALSHRAVALADGLRVVIADTRALRQLAGSEYGERRAACEEGARLLGVPALRDLDAATFAAHEAELPPLVARRCRFVIEENARVLAMAEALPAGDRAAIGGLCAESFQGACELYEIGAPAMSAMHAALLSAPGVIGARQAGAGFGGCLVALVEADACEACATSAEAAYAAATGLTPSIFAVDAAAGAGVVAP